MASPAYDPDTRFPDAQQGSQHSDPRIAAIHGEVDKTIQSLKNTIETTNDRGDRLNNLQNKTDNLATSAQGFRRGANRVRKDMWWKDMKMRMCIIAGIIILILIIVIPIVVTKK